MSKKEQERLEFLAKQEDSLSANKYWMDNCEWDDEDCVIVRKSLIVLLLFIVAIFIKHYLFY